MSSAGLLLAAGQSRRFGSANKLLAELEGVPLVTHAARALRTSGLSPLVAVVADGAVAEVLEGFRIVAPAQGGAAQSLSLRVGVEALNAASRITVVLGDMPRVTAALIREVVAACPDGGASAVLAGSSRMPPACFHRDLFPDLLALDGDRGAGALLGRIPDACLVRADKALLGDVDRPEDLAALTL